MSGSFRWDLFRACLEFRYLGCVLDESGTDGAEFSWKVPFGRRVAGAIRSLVNARELQLECASLT